ncbi:MAG TPA: FG-GAP-like repeat-containing protein, partial [Polyangia bacterium]|nr:FG-GAP-like repeat-containing protein [Polyangia bacterium]
MSQYLLALSPIVLALQLSACGGSSRRPPQPLPEAVCTATVSGQAATQAPVLRTTLKDRYQEAWLASPAVADLDGDGRKEIVVPRDSRVVAWQPDGAIKWFVDVPEGRIWASPLVADFTGDARLEVVVAARGSIYMFDAAGAIVSGFPVAWRDEIRSLAAGDVDGDGRLEIVAVTTTPLSANNQRDIILVVRANGAIQPGFPPNTTGTAGCDTRCYVTGGYDQNVAVGPIDEDTRWDIFSGQDNAYLSWHHGSGVAFDANAIFPSTKVLGVRFLHDYIQAQQGYADDEQTADQAHFTNSAPAIADVDGDGKNDLVVLGSVQNAAQTDRLRGVGLWVLNSDGSRPATWLTPYHVPAYLAGLYDFDGTNVVAATNQVSVADLDPSTPGLDMVFAGFDGKIHLVGADRRERWSYTYATANNVLTGGVTIADLSGDGVPEVVFASYSTQEGVSALYVLDAAGNLQQRVPLPKRGAMPVPTIADVDGDGTLEIVVSLKDGEDRQRSVLVYSVPGSQANCLMWPTGRGNDLRNGFFRLGP